MENLTRRIRRIRPFSVVFNAENAAHPIGGAFGGRYFGCSAQMHFSARHSAPLGLSNFYY